MKHLIYTKHVKLVYWGRNTVVQYGAKWHFSTLWCEFWRFTLDIGRQP